MSESVLMVGLGEILWDLLPSGKVLGGAPTNFAYMANVLGNQGIVASRIGEDRLGHEAYEAMQRLSLSTAYLQRDDRCRTGTARAVLGLDGQATFTIEESVSWDFLEWTPGWEELSQRADVVCFGTLAQRSPASAVTIDEFLRHAPASTLRICDVNLRQSFYSAEIVRSSLCHAHVAKLTDQELRCICSLLGLGAGEECELARNLSKEFELKLVCVTRGPRGSLLVSEREMVEHTGFNVHVVDTVGAGDAFAACLAHHLIRGESLERTCEFANRFASWVVTQVGATPRIDRTQLHAIMEGEAAEQQVHAHRVEPGF